MILKKIWFADDRIYGLSDEGKTVWQSLLWYKRLKYPRVILVQGNQLFSSDRILGHQLMGSQCNSCAHEFGVYGLFLSGTLLM